MRVCGQLAVPSIDKFTVPRTGQPSPATAGEGKAVDARLVGRQLPAGSRDFGRRVREVT